MNSLAEELTGWQRTEAVGRKVEEVFQLIEEDTRRPVPPPLLHSPEPYDSTGQARNTLLIAKNRRNTRWRRVRP
jgi:PAS domain-containing protein